MATFWIAFTLMAAFMQSIRNALQKQLRSHTSTLGVTLARFIIALPFAAMYLFILYTLNPGTPLPILSTHDNLCFALFVAIAAISQIAATAFMVLLFKTKNYAIGVGLAKSEAIIAAVLGALFFAAPLSAQAWLGVAIGGVAVWYMSIGTSPNTSRANTSHASSSQASSLPTRTLITGVASGLCFALCTLYIRESALLLRENGFDFLISASWVLFFVLLTQTVTLTLYLLIKEPATLKQLYHHKKLTTAVSTFSFFGSIGWFTAMSLQTVAMVKTLGQLDVLFTLLISYFYFKEQLHKSDYIGLVFIVISAVLVMT